LREFFTFDFFDRAQKDASIPLDDPRSDAVALDMAREEMVLLKNQDRTLPLDRKKIHSIAVLGPNADPAVWSGSGSSDGLPFHAVSVLAGVRAVAGSSVDVRTVPWWLPPKDSLHPETVFPRRPSAELIAASVRAAREADVAVVCVGFRGFGDTPSAKMDLSAMEGEGGDRSYALPLGQVQLIQAVAAVNPHTVVILNAGGGVDWNGWLEKVPALIDAWYPGQEGGRALAEILFGEVNPSGKLPATFEKKWADNPSSRYYDAAADHKAVYGEGIFAGYRGFDQKGIEPRFPFGFGLSYTKFDYSNLRIEPPATADAKVAIRFEVKNTETVAGAEIAQVYVGDPHASVPRPPKELKGFSRVDLAPGEMKIVSVELDRRAFCFYDVPGKSWKFEPGEFTIQVGASSRDIRLRQGVILTGY